jgi:hypothetical protein
MLATRNDQERCALSCIPNQPMVPQMSQGLSVVTRTAGSENTNSDLRRENAQLKKIVAQLTKIILKHAAERG